MKKEVDKRCEKLETNVNKLDSLVKRNKELESKNKELLERNCELNRQISKMQEVLAVKDKVRFYAENPFLRLIIIANSYVF